MIQNNIFLLSECMNILTLEGKFCGHIKFMKIQRERGQGTGEFKGDKVGGSERHLL